MKSWRQAQILDVIDHEPVVSQEILRQRLIDLLGKITFTTPALAAP